MREVAGHSAKLERERGYGNLETERLHAEGCFTGNMTLVHRKSRDGANPWECCREGAQGRHSPTSLFSLQPFLCASCWLNSTRSWKVRQI